MTPDDNPLGGKTLGELAGEKLARWAKADKPSAINSLDEIQRRASLAKCRKLEIKAERAELRLQRERVDPEEMAKRIVSAFNLKWSTRDDEARVIDHVEEILRAELGLGGAE